MRPSRRRAFTLLEGMIASLILTLAVLGVAGALTVASSQTQAYDVDAESLAIARLMMEGITARPFDAPTTNQGSGNSADTEESALPAGGDDGDKGGGDGADGNSLGTLEGTSGTGTGGGIESLHNSIGSFDGLTSITLAPETAGHLVELISYHTTVSVQFRSTPSGPANPSGDFALVTVTTTPSQLGRPVTLHRMVTRFTRVNS